MQPMTNLGTFGSIGSIGSMIASGLAAWTAQLAAPPLPHDAAALKFPKSFIWGAATAAYQIEGGNDNTDWWEWEAQCHLPGCERSGQAVDGYHRYEEDLTLAQGMNLGAYRMSVEWARIEPRQGEFSQKELDHYKDVLRAARARGLKTVLTLHHFTLPLWVAHHTPGQESWVNPAISDLFAPFVERVVRELGDQVDYWVTINEPMVNMLTAYVVGVSPPGLQDFKKAPLAAAHFLKAHARAYHIIHATYPKAMVSVAHHARVFDPASGWNPMDQATAGLLHDFWNHQFLRSIRTGQIRFNIPGVVDYKESYPPLKGTLDYLGVNYYSRDLIHFAPRTAQKFEIVPNKKAPKNDIGWEIYPFGMYRVLKDLYTKYKLPILITESGTADASDSHRGRYLCSHLAEVWRAMQDDVHVIGYLHWSLIDNFEWSLGHAPRFGLVGVDYEDGLKRTPRPSAALYGEIARTGSLAGCGR